MSAPLAWAAIAADWAYRHPVERQACIWPISTTPGRRTRLTRECGNASRGIAGRLLIHVSVHGATERKRSGIVRYCKARSYQLRLLLTMRTSQSINGTSISTPTTVASAAPESKP